MHLSIRAHFSVGTGVFKVGVETHTCCQAIDCSNIQSVEETKIQKVKVIHVLFKHPSCQKNVALIDSLLEFCGGEEETNWSVNRGGETPSLPTFLLVVSHPPHPKLLLHNQMFHPYCQARNIPLILT